MIWFGTDGGGVSSFDGDQFKSFTTSDGLVDNHINCVSESINGNLLFGSDNGVSLYNGHKFTTLLNNKSILSLLEIDPNQVWLGSDKGIISFSEGVAISLEELKELEQSRINALSKFNKGILIGSDKGLFYFNIKEKKLRKYDDRILAHADVTDIQGWENDILWVCTRDKGLYSIHNGKLRRILDESHGLFSSASGLDDETVAVALEDKGLLLYNFVYEELTGIREFDGLAHDRLSHVYKDMWNQLWVATLGNGVSKFSGKSIQVLGEQYGIPENSIRPLHVSDDNNVWFGHSSTRLGKFDGTNYFNFDQSLGFNPARINCIYGDNTGQVWIGTQDKGLILKDRTGFNRVDLPESFSIITDIKKDERGNLWISSEQGGIMMVDLVKSGIPGFQIFSKENYLQDNHILNITPSSDGQLWIKDEPGNFYVMSVLSKGVDRQNLEELSGKMILDQKLDQFENMWLVYQKGGIGSIILNRTPKVVNHILEGSLVNTDVSHIETIEDQLLLVHKEGIDRYKIDSMGQIEFEGSIDMKAYTNDFLSNINSTDISKDYIWLGTTSGLVRINLDQDQSHGRIPRVSISKVNLLYDDLYQTEYAQLLDGWYNSVQTLVFKPEENDISFEFQSTIPDANLKVEYQWKLEGYEEDWAIPSETKSVSYSNLPYGSYRFFVKAVCDDLEFVSRPFEFEIRQVVYQKTWFKLLMVGILMLTMLLFYRTRVRLLKDKTQREQKELEVQLSTLSLEQKSLQLQMNPHFIFNSLNSIQGLIVNRELSNARKHLNKFSSLMRKFLQFSRSESINLEEEMEMLRDYMSLEQFSRGDKFDFEIETKIEDQDEVRIPPMMIQPFVENAIIHGINHLDKKGHILVSFYEIGNKIKCVVDDNGIGRKASSEIRTSIHESSAIKVIKERLKILHRNSRLDPLKFVDKLDEDRQPDGTRVEVLLPIINN